MTFSWKQNIDRALDIKLRRAKTMVKGQVNPDFDLQFPNEIREYAKTGTHTELTKRVKDNFAKKQKELEVRRLKNV